VVKDSPAHSNGVSFPPIVVTFGYFGYVDYHQFYLGVLGLHVVAFGFVWFVGCGCLECSFQTNFDMLIPNVDIKYFH
jgi:hypothetical protein